jgi:hypothetical protein
MLIFAQKDYEIAEDVGWDKIRVRASPAFGMVDGARS